MEFRPESEQSLRLETPEYSKENEIPKELREKFAELTIQILIFKIESMENKQEAMRLLGDGTLVEKSKIEARRELGIGN